MLVPPQDLINFINSLYPQLTEIFLLNTSICFKYTSHKQLTPYFIAATKYHVFFYSFHQKDEQKKIKIFNINDSRINVGFDERLNSQHQNLCQFYSLQDTLIIKFLNEQDLDIWSQIINLKTPTSLQISNFGDNFELQGFDFSLKRAEVKHNSTDQIQLILNDFYGQFQRDNNKDIDLILKERSGCNWQAEYNRLLIKLEQNINNSPTINYGERDIVYQKLIIQDKQFISEQLEQLLLKQKLTDANQFLIEQMLKQTENDNLTSILIEIFKLIGDFKIVSEWFSKIFVNEFSLPSHEQQFNQQFEQQSAYLQQISGFQTSIEKLSEEEKMLLEKYISQVGPVHGVLAYFNVSQYERIRQVCIQTNFNMSEEQIEQMLRKNKITYSQLFPNNLIETQADKYLNFQYPNQLAPVNNFTICNINFSINVSNKHSQLNINRSSQQFSQEDEKTITVQFNEIEILTLILQQQIKISNQKIHIPLVSNLYYGGFNITCKNIIEDNIVYVESQPTTLNSDLQKDINSQLSNLAEKFNIASHLIQIQQQNQSDAFLISSVQINSFLINLSKQLKSENYDQFSQFIIDNKQDIIDQQPQVKNANLSQNDKQSAINFLTCQLSQKLKISEFQNNFSFKHLTSLLLADFPSEFMQNIIVSNEILSQQQLEDLRIYSQKYALPVKFTQLINQKYNPDFLYQDLIDGQQMQKLEFDLIEHLETINYNSSNVDSIIFFNYIMAKLFNYQTSESVKSSVRWSDSYRLHYLPQLSILIDRQINSTQILPIDVISILKYFQVPKYLWLYTANFSIFSEVQDVVKLHLLAEATATIFNQKQRQLRRKIQQFGLRDAPFFTAKSKKERENNVEIQIKKFSSEFLNDLLSEDFSGQLWNDITEIFVSDFIQHSFGDVYGQKVSDSNFGKEIRYSMCQNSLDDIFKQENKKFLFLSFFQDITGIIIKQSFKYDFSNRPFENDDIQGFKVVQTHDIIPGILSQFLYNQNSINTTCQIIDEQIGQLYSFSSQYVNKEITNVPNMFLTTRNLLFEKPSLMLKKLSFQVLYSGYNSKLFVDCLIQSIRSLTSWMEYKFESIVTEKEAKSFAHYVQTIKILISHSYRICNPISTLHTQILFQSYKSLFLLEQFFQKLSFETKQQILQYTYDIPYNMPNNAIDALQLTIQHSLQLNGPESVELIKLRIQFAQALIKQEKLKLALDQFLIVEQILLKNELKSQILVEVLNSIGCLLISTNNQTQALTYLEKAFNLNWMEMNKVKIQVINLENSQQLLTQYKVLNRDKPQPQRKLILIQNFQQTPQQINTYHGQLLLNKLNNLNLLISDAEQQDFDQILQIKSAEIFSLVSMQLQKQITYYNQIIGGQNLYLSQILENSVVAQLGSKSKDSLYEIKQTILKSIKIRANTLSRNSYFTLQSVYILSQIDCKLADFEAALSSYEHIIKQLSGNDLRFDLNVVKVVNFQEKDVVMMLLSTVFQSLSSDILAVIKHYESRPVQNSSNLQIQKEFDVILSLEEGVVNSIVKFIYDAINEENHEKLSYLHQYLITEGNVEIVDSKDFVYSQTVMENVSQMKQIEENDWI